MMSKPARDRQPIFSYSNRRMSTMNRSTDNFRLCTILVILLT